MTASVSDRLDVMVVEPYYGGSHRSWADGLVAHSRHRVRLVTHDAQFWRWRMRGAAVTLAEAVRASVATDGPPELVVVSDMVDVAALVGFLRRDLDPSVPVAVYFHENQLVYPLGPDQRFDEGLALRNWTSAAVADAVWFNSEFHRQVFFGAVRDLLRRPPDHRHLDLVDRVEAAAAVMPVGVDLADLATRPRASGGDDDADPLVVWNQRWDHDKNPEAVFRALVKLAEAGVGFRLAVVGENTRVDPAEFGWVRQRLGARVIHAGYLDRPSYVDLLLSADVHVTAARHEFFGIAAVEAAAAGCVPVWPDRLSYPELLPEWARPLVLYADGDLRVALEGVLGDVAGHRQRLAPLRDAMVRFDWSQVAPCYDAAAEALVDRARGVRPEPTMASASRAAAGSSAAGSSAAGLSGAGSSANPASPGAPGAASPC